MSVGIEPIVRYACVLPRARGWSRPPWPVWRSSGTAGAGTEHGEWYGLAVWWQPVSYGDGSVLPEPRLPWWISGPVVTALGRRTTAVSDRTWLGPDPCGWPRPQDRPGARWRRTVSTWEWSTVARSGFRRASSRGTSAVANQTMASYRATLTSLQKSRTQSICPSIVAPLQFRHRYRTACRRRGRACSSRFNTREVGLALGVTGRHG